MGIIGKINENMIFFKHSKYTYYNNLKVKSIHKTDIFSNKNVHLLNFYADN